MATAVATSQTCKAMDRRCAQNQAEDPSCSPSYDSHKRTCSSSWEHPAHTVAVAAVRARNINGVPCLLRHGARRSPGRRCPWEPAINNRDAARKGFGCWTMALRCCTQARKRRPSSLILWLRYLRNPTSVWNPQKGLRRQNRCASAHMHVCEHVCDVCAFGACMGPDYAPSHIHALDKGRSYVLRKCSSAKLVRLPLPGRR